MQVVLKHEIKRVKNGFCARSPELGLSAHGFDKEVARLNLQSAIRLLLAPFERHGSLFEEISRSGVRVTEADQKGITVILE